MENWHTCQTHNSERLCSPQSSMPRLPFELNMSELRSMRTWQAAVAEFLAVFILVFVAVGATNIAATFGEESASADVILMGLANGLAISVGIAAFYRVSGAHINPAVTIAAVVTGNACAARGVIYIVFQLAGAVAASAFLRIVSDVPDLGVHRVNAAYLNPAAGLGLEIVITFILVAVVFATAVDPRRSNLLIPFAVGGVVAINSFVALPLTGASMNPARSFGPAFVYASWAEHWIYWVGPILGAVAAGVSYTLFFGTEEMKSRMKLSSLWTTVKPIPESPREPV